MHSDQEIWYTKATNLRCEGLNFTQGCTVKIINCGAESNVGSLCMCAEIDWDRARIREYPGKFFVFEPILQQKLLHDCLLLAPLEARKVRILNVGLISLY